jgi:hypothetical protein
MRKLFGICLLVTGMSVDIASGQTSATGAAPDPRTPSAPGIDVWQTLYPRPPQYNPPTDDLRLQTLDASAQPNAQYNTQPKGFTAGAYTVYPSITGAMFYDDNVFALNRAKLADYAFVARPELGFKSNNLDNADIVANVAVEGRKYMRFDSEDQFNAAAAVGGTFTLTPDMQFIGRLAYTRGHEDRGTSDTILTEFDKPIGYNQYEAAGAFNNRFGRFWTSVGAAAAWIDYEDALLFGVPISQDYRNGTIARVPVRMGYVVAPSTSLFVEVSGNSRDFKVDSFDSTGYRVVGGALFEPGPNARVKGEIYAGYMNQRYDGFGFEPVSTWTAGGSLAWLATDTITVVAEGQRQAKEASLSGGIIPGDGVSVVESIATLRVDQRLTPKLVLGGGVSYVRDEFKGANRIDDSWSPLVSLKYFVDPTLTLGFDYRYVTYGSDLILVPSYTRNVYVVSANARF